jgi:SAM-dependent methyltransferase
MIWDWLGIGLEFCLGSAIRACVPSKPTDYYDWVSAYRSYRRYVTPTAKVLEIGASRPDKTRELSRWCAELIGVELLARRTPKDFANVRYFTGDWQNLSTLVPSNSIDLAISTHVLEHVPNDLRAVNELYEVLRPGGRAILNTPNRKRLVRAVIEKFSGERVFPFGEHVREYLEQDLIRLFESSRFPEFYIRPVVFGVHGGPFFLYSTIVPKRLRGLTNFWEIHLLKE